MTWCLIGRVAKDDQAHAVPISSERFTIGRKEAVSLRVHCESVSKLHAELLQLNSELWVRDLGSTNGTFVNGVRVQAQTQLQNGDLLQVASMAFRVAREHRTANFHTAAVDAADEALLCLQLERLLSDHSVWPKYQPIVDLRTRQVQAYEALARSRLFGLNSPKVMFEVASRLDLEPQLSHIMRLEAVKQSQASGAPHLFVNTHPRELEVGKLSTSLQEMRKTAPNQPITLEIHEAAATDPDRMQAIRAMLRDHDIGLAFDDFGVGQTRLQEIAATPPDYLKFDMSMIRDIDQAPAARQNVVRFLVNMAQSLNVRTLAEGVQTEGEHNACVQLGFELGQGFYYGKPAELPTEQAPSPMPG